MGGPTKYRPIMGGPQPTPSRSSVSVSICPYSYHVFSLIVTKSLKWSKLIKYGPLLKCITYVNFRRAPIFMGGPRNIIPVGGPKIMGGPGKNGGT